MISRHGTAGSDDPDESPGAAGDDDDGGQLVRLQPAALRQSPEGREAARRLHGGGPGAEMLSRSSPVDLQVRQRQISQWDPPKVSHYAGFPESRASTLKLGTRALFVLRCRRTFPKFERIPRD